MKELIAVTATPADTIGVRTEFGYNRTACACPECVNNCRHIPGYLIPADVGRIAHHLGFTNLVEFAFRFLLASPGATVMQAGGVFQIPTLVPRRKEDGSCILLNERNLCRIHEVSPYGCAFFDAHQSDAEAQRRSGRGLQDIAGRWAVSPNTHAYTVIWKLLCAAGLRAVPAHVARRRMALSLAATDESKEEAASTL
jgi:Fe-S-cluster containining protein